MAVGDAYVFPSFLTPVLTQLFFPKPRLLFSHASAEVRGETTPERKVTSTRNHQDMSLTHSPFSHPDGGKDWLYWGFNTTLTAKVISWRSVTHMCFPSFQSHRQLFSHASPEVRSENTPMSPTCSPLSHQGGATNWKNLQKINRWVSATIFWMPIHCIGT